VYLKDTIVPKDQTKCAKLVEEKNNQMFCRLKCSSFRAKNMYMCTFLQNLKELLDRKLIFFL